METPRKEAQASPLDLSLKACDASMASWNLSLRLNPGERLCPRDSKELLIQLCLKLARLSDLLAMRTNTFSFMFKPHLSQIASHQKENESSFIQV